MKNFFPLLLLAFFIFSCSSDNNSNSNTDKAMYFPPNDGSTTWETKSISALGWNANAVQPLIDYLQLINYLS